jgi:hypothetical protein
MSGGWPCRLTALLGLGVQPVGLPLSHQSFMVGYLADGLAQSVPARPDHDRRFTPGSHEYATGFAVQIQLSTTDQLSEADLDHAREVAQTIVQRHIPSPTSVEVTAYVHVPARSAAY